MPLEICAKTLSNIASTSNKHLTKRSTQGMCYCKCCTSVSEFGILFPSSPTRVSCPASDRPSLRRFRDHILMSSNDCEKRTDATCPAYDVDTKTAFRFLLLLPPSILSKRKGVSGLGAAVVPCQEKILEVPQGLLGRGARPWKGLLRNRNRLSNSIDCCQFSCIASHRKS